VYDKDNATAPLALAWCHTAVLSRWRAQKQKAESKT
jgi:hypothetical protein